MKSFTSLITLVWYFTGLAVCMKWGFWWLILGFIIPIIPFIAVPYQLMFG